MILTLTGRFSPVAERARHLIAVAATLAFFVLIVAAVASTYFGRSSSPYDTCFGPNGRAIACATLERARHSR